MSMADYFPEGKGHVEWEPPVEPSVEQAITALRFLADITIAAARRNRFAGYNIPSESFDAMRKAVVTWLKGRAYDREDGVMIDDDVAVDAQKLLELAAECRDQGLEAGVHILRLFWDFFAEDVGSFLEDGMRFNPVRELDASTRSIADVDATS